MVELQPDLSLETLQDLLTKREFSECVRLGNVLLQDAKLRSGQGAAADYKIGCYLAVGDAHFGLKEFQQSLKEYEKARTLAEQRFGLISDEAMTCLFRTERAVKAVAQEEGLSADTNIRARTLLLEAEVAQRTTGPQRPVRHSRTLQGLWAVALDKQKSHGKNPLVQLVEFIINKLNTARLEEYLSRISIVVSSTGLICMAVYTFFWCYLHPNPTAVNPVPHGHFLSINQSRTHKGALWAFRTISGDNNTIAWSHDGKAQISETDVPGDSKLAVIVCNHTPAAMLAALVSSCANNNLLLRWNGYSLLDQNGVVYYDTTEPEFAVAQKVYALEAWAEKYFKDHGKYPTSGDIGYVNPITKRPDKIATINSKDWKDKFLSELVESGAVPAHPGMIACGSGLRQFSIGALDRMKNPIPLLSYHNEFLVLTPNTKSTAAELSEALTRVNGVVVFEEAVDPLSYFICAHTMLLFTSFVLVLGAVGPMIFLTTKNWRTTLRAPRKKPPVGEPSAR